jgi:hypothetical protein
MLHSLSQEVIFKYCLGKRAGGIGIPVCRYKIDFKEIGCDVADWIYLTNVWWQDTECC